ncbi:MAG: radical SAM family heme chaperone HemW [Bacteroidales bacterium]
MSSLYLHIPFCHHKCIYCGFYSVAQHTNKNLYVDCLIKELQQRKNFLTEKLQTIYFGGGTPSVLSLQQVEKIMENIHIHYDTSNVKEITFEINPENANKEYLQGLKKLGINRLSIGIESFNDRDLRLLNRSHNSEVANQSIINALSVGYENISIDLMSNLPFSNFNIHKNNLTTFLSYPLTHLSCYTLMIEQGTMLKRLIDKGKYTLMSEEDAIREFDYTMEILEQHNYLHYETSSFARDGYTSQHNMVYWTFQPYLGIGAAAHSYNKNIRQWNEDNLQSYINYFTCNNSPNILHTEYLCLEDRYNEYIMLTARIQHGLNKEHIKSLFADYYNVFTKRCNEMTQAGLLNPDLSLTRKGWHLQDTLILNLCNV